MSLSRFLNRGRSSGVRQSIKSTISIGPLRRTFSSHQADGCAETVTKPPTRKIHVVKLIHPHVPYKASLKWMLDLVTAKASKTDPELRDVLFIVQHKPVFTLGKAAKHENVKFPLDERCPYEVHHLERGGEATYHGPGQLTVYPVLQLNSYKRDLHWYVNSLEKVVTGLLADFNIVGGPDPINPGVWVGKDKVAAIGIKVHRWITMHGIGLNVTPSVRPYFNEIVPCGIQERGVTDILTCVRDAAQQHSNCVDSVSAAADVTIPWSAGDDDTAFIDAVADKFVRHFGEVFEVACIHDTQLCEEYLSDPILKEMETAKRLHGIEHHRHEVTGRSP